MDRRAVAEPGVVGEEEGQAAEVKVDQSAAFPRHRLEMTTPITSRRARTRLQGRRTPDPEEVPALKDTSRMASKDQGRGNIATREDRKILRVSLDCRAQIYSD